MDETGTNSMKAAPDQTEPAVDDLDAAADEAISGGATRKP
jgi:hypothetical protein